MPVGKGSVARAAKAAGTEPKKSVSKRKAMEPGLEKAEVQAAVIAAPAVEKKSTAKRGHSPKKAAEPVGRMQRGELDGIMVIKSDLPIELL